MDYINDGRLDLHLSVNCSFKMLSEEANVSECVRLSAGCVEVFVRVRPSLFKTEALCLKIEQLKHKHGLMCRHFVPK